MQQLRLKTKIAEASPLESKQGGQSTLKVLLSGLGVETQEVQLTSGETLGDLLKAHKVEKLEVRVNKEEVPLSTQLKDGDIIVVVPDAIVRFDLAAY